MTPEVWSSPEAVVAGVWAAAALTLMAFTYAVGDNPLYRIVEHLFVGVAAAYGLVVAVHHVLVPRLAGPVLAGQPPDLRLAPALLLGLLLLGRGTGSGSSSVLAVALLVGSAAGLGLAGAAAGTLVPQTLAASGLLPGAGPALLNGGVSLTLTVLVLLYFHFGERPSLGRWPLPGGLWRGTRRLGYLGLMAALGGVLGVTALSRFSILVARLDFLLSQWLHLR